MNSKQIDELNMLLKDHGEILTAFYDEGIRYGMLKGFSCGIIGGTIGISTALIIQKLVKHFKTKK